MSLVGLGSVSAYTLELAECPVAVVQGGNIRLKARLATAAASFWHLVVTLMCIAEGCWVWALQGEQHVLLLVESSTTSDALQWTLGNTLRPGDHLHLLCVGEPTAKLVGGLRSLAEKGGVGSWGGEVGRQRGRCMPEGKRGGGSWGLVF